MYELIGKGKRHKKCLFIRRKGMNNLGWEEGEGEATVVNYLQTEECFKGGLRGVRGEQQSNKTTSVTDTYKVCHYCLNRMKYLI